MPASAYPIRIGARSRWLLRALFGVTRERAWATIDDRSMVARLGWWRIEIPLTEISHWSIEGPWRWITAIGVRRSLRGGELSFAGSPEGGVRLDLRQSMRWTVFHVRTFYVGVDDLEGFASELRSRGIPGVDARGAR